MKQLNGRVTAKQGSYVKEMIITQPVRQKLIISTAGYNNVQCNDAVNYPTQFHLINQTR